MTRYSPECPNACEMIENPSGSWVPFSDVSELLEENDDLRQRVAELESDAQVHE